MAKLKSGIGTTLFIGTVFVLIILIIIRINGGLPAQVLTGTNNDSDLLVLSGNPVYQNGTLQPLTGMVVKIFGQVGIGNDVANVGSYDKETSRATNVPTDYSNPEFSIYSKKVKMNTLLTVNKSAPYSIASAYKFDKSQHTVSVIKGINVFGGTCAASVVGPELMQKGMYACNTAGGQYYIMQSIMEFDYDLFNKKCETTVDCYKKNESSALNFYNYGNKILDMNLQFQVVNNKNQESSIVNITNASQSATFTSGGTTIGAVQFTGTMGDLVYPLDLTDDKAGTYQGSWYNYTIGNIGTWDTYRIALSLPNPTGNSIPLSSNFSSSEALTKNSQFTSLTNAYTTLFNSRKTYIDNKTFNVDQSGTNPVYVFESTNEAVAVRPTVEIQILGEWLGITRNVADLSISCNPTSITLNRGERKTSTVTVRNNASYSSPYSLAYNCAAGIFSTTENVSGNSSKNYTVDWSQANSGSGTCVFYLNYSGNNKSCSTTYSIAEPPPYTCGNNVCESSVGETTLNCPQDCSLVCPVGTRNENGVCVPDGCPPPKVYCGGQCISPCSLGYELNDNCKCVVSGCPNGTEKINNQCLPVCAANEVRNPSTFKCENKGIDLFWLIVGAGIIIVGGVAGYVFIKKKK